MSTTYDPAELFEELVEGRLGDHIRELHVQGMLDDLAGDDYDGDREWANGVAQWLRDQYL